jgi:hypothetical protein
VSWTGSWPRCAPGLAALVLCALSAASCGARTGLYADTSSGSDPADPNRSRIAEADAALPIGLAGASPACVTSLLEANSRMAEAGTVCMAAAQMLQCDVAMNGQNEFPNFCVTSNPDCSATEDSSCQPQCGAGEYGVLCADISVPDVPGCRILWPASAPGPAGLAFCCGCG